MKKTRSFSTSAIRQSVTDFPWTLQEWCERLAEAVEHSVIFILTAQDWDLSRAEEYARIVDDGVGLSVVYLVASNELIIREGDTQLMERQDSLIRTADLFREIGIQNLKHMHNQKSFWRERRRFLLEITLVASILSARRLEKGKSPVLILNDHSLSGVNRICPRYQFYQFQLVEEIMRSARSKFSNSFSADLSSSRHQAKDDGIFTQSISPTVAPLPSSLHRLGLPPQASLGSRQPVLQIRSCRQKRRNNAKSNQLKIRKETANRLRKKLELKKSRHVDQHWIMSNLVICSVCSKFHGKGANSARLCKTCRRHVCYFCDCSMLHLHTHDLEETTIHLIPRNKAKKKNRKTKKNESVHDSIDVIDASKSTTSGITKVVIGLDNEFRPSECAGGAEESREVEDSRALVCTDVRDREPAGLLDVLIETGSILALADYLEEQESEGVDLDIGYNPATDFPWEYVITSSNESETEAKSIK